MEKQIYRVIFSGKIKSDAKPAEVRTKLAQLFKLDVNDPDHRLKLSKLFSGRTVVVKQGLTLEKALAYQEAVNSSGAISTLEPMQPSELAAEAPGGIERRKEPRRIKGDRRSAKRTSSIRPDRRGSKGRRKTDI